MKNEQIAGGSLGELRDALRILADCHTRDDYSAGFVVENTRDPLSDGAEYLHAWTVVRLALGYQVDPRFGARDQDAFGEQRKFGADHPVND